MKYADFLIGKTVKHFRRSKCLTLHKVAVLTGINQSGWTKIETGQRSIKYRELLGFLGVTKIKQEQFFLKMQSINPQVTR